jgi:preprotein translocase subunit SecD
MMKPLSLPLLAIVAALVCGCPRQRQRPAADPEFLAQPGANPSVSFEIRLAEREPADGLEEKTHRGLNRTVYVHPEVLFTNSDVKGTAVGMQVQLVGAPPQPIIAVFFTNKATARFADFTAANVHRKIAILVDGKVCTAPVIQEKITGGRIEILFGFEAEKEAVRVAKGIVGL